MKRTLSLLLLLAMVVMSVASCSTPAENNNEKDYTLGIGVAMTISGVKASATVAAVVTDADGKITLCRIDAIDSESKIGADGAPVVSALTSKYELGDNYNMVTYGGAQSEWYKQAEAFEAYVVGKTLAEVKATALEAGKPTDADLAAGCTIAVTDFITAIANAVESKETVSFKADGVLTAAVAVNASLTATAETLTYKTAFDFSAVVAEDGVVVAARIDSAETTIVCEKDADNKLTASSTKYDGTKLELGDNYNMVAYGQAQSEWYVQAGIFANTAVGNNASALDTLPTENVAGCTIYVGGYKAVLVKAGKNVR